MADTDDAQSMGEPPVTPRPDPADSPLADQTPADLATLPAEAATQPGAASPVTGVEMSALDSEAVALRNVDASTISGKRVWRAGTLTYTFGGLVILFVLLLGGDFAFSMRDRSIGTPIQYMLKRLHASDTLIAITFAVLPPLLNLVVTPVVSFKSDRLRSRWGRRVPYLLIPAPFAALAMVVISYSEPLGRIISDSFGAGGPTPERCALAFFVPAWTVFEVAALIAAAVMGGLINDVVPRELLGRFFGLFRAVSLGAAMIFNKFLISYSETHYRVIFISLAVIFLVGFAGMCLGVKEGEYPPPAPVDPDDTAARRFAKSINIYFRECFNHRYYFWMFASMAFAACAFQPVNLFTILYAEQLHIGKQQVGDWLFLTYACSFVMAWPLGWLVDKAHALRVSMIVMAVYAVVMLVAFAFVRDGKTFGAALIVHGVLSGTYFTTSAALGQALFPRMKFAQFASAGGLVQSLLTIGLGLGLGQLLDRTGHNYRLTFAIGGVFGGLAVLSMIVVYAGFQRFGGRAAYVPPE